jgi:hypothetical protein
MTAIEHVRYLVETIGPRGSTRPGEARAARYAYDVLCQLGLKPVREPFTSARSKYHPYALSIAIGLIGVALFWLGGQTFALLALAL